MSAHTITASKRRPAAAAAAAPALLLTLLGVAVPAAQAQKIGDKGRFIICLPGGPGDSEMAKPAMNTLAEAIAPLLGKQTIEGDYTTNRELCARALNNQPLFALVPLSIYLSEGRKAKLEPVAQVVSPEMGGDDPRFYVMVQAAGIAKLGDLDGKRLAIGPVGDERFVRKVIFEGKLPAGTTLVAHRSVVAAVKAVSRGQADAVLLDGIERPRVKEIPGGENLREVASTRKLELPPVLTSSAQAASIRKALVALCKTERGKEACHELRLNRISPARASTFAAVARAYGAP